MKLDELKVLLAVTVVLLMGVFTAAADDFNPVNPPEPQTLSKLTVKATPAGVAATTGTGRYKTGTRIYLNASAIDTDYEFKRWEKDGQTISTAQRFYYTTGGVDETITAVYEYKVFNPPSPSEPFEVYKWILYLEGEPQEACSFNLDNGSRHLAGEKFNITAYPNQGFVFQGWYEGETRISDQLTVYYTMPRSNARLSARFVFIPDSPGEPEGGAQGNVDNTVNYDINQDGVVNTTDSSFITSHYLEDWIYSRKYDVSGDGVVNVSDVSAIISRYLGQ